VSRFSEKREIKLGNEAVVMDPQDLRFTDRTLNEFFERVSGRIDYIGRALADAEALYLMREQEVESLFADKFRYWKEEGKSDKTAEMYAKGEQMLKDAKVASKAARHNKTLLYNHLQALHAAREQANNRGHFMRKEMEKINTGIYSHDLDSQIDDIVQNAAAYQSGEKS
jgi:hypothetical protein